MKMILRAVILGVFFVFGTLAGAFAAQENEGGALRPGRLNASDLMELCAGKYDVDLGFCAGYVTAIADVMIDQPLYGFRACTHETVKSQQIMDNVILKTKAMPERSGFAARAVVADSIARAFPCF